MKTVLVTGANGFVASSLIPLLKKSGHKMVAVSRREVGDMGPETQWATQLDDVECVVHLAARVHMMTDTCAEPLAEYRKVNVQGTLRLAREAVRAGVKKFIYLSSIKVLGEESDLPYTASSVPAPKDPYGVSKWEAEQALQQLASETGLEVTVFRPPLVYGPGVKANFLALMGAVDKRIPLPFGSITNRRSLVYVGNLADAIRAAIEAPQGKSRTFLISDGVAVSTSELVRAIGAAFDKPALQIPVPTGVLKILGRITGKSASISRLLGSLEVSNTEIHAKLGWQPPYTLQEGLKETIKWYNTSRSS